MSDKHEPLSAAEMEQAALSARDFYRGEGAGGKVIHNAADAFEFAERYAAYTIQQLTARAEAAEAERDAAQERLIDVQAELAAIAEANTAHFEARQRAEARETRLRECLDKAFGWIYEVGQEFDMHDEANAEHAALLSDIGAALAAEQKEQGR